MATITQRESGRWQAKVRRQGQSPRSRTFKTKAGAEAWARKLESEQERGVWHDGGEADRTTLAACLDRFVLEQVPSKSDPDRERSHVDALRALPFVDSVMTRVRSADVAAARDAWAAAGYAPATIVRRLAVLSRVFNVARREWGMESLSNPVELTAKPAVRNARTRRLGDAEIEAICAATGSIELEAIVRLALETGMRRGEILEPPPRKSKPDVALPKKPRKEPRGLRWEYVDLDARKLHLPHTKNGHERDVPLSSRAVELLSALPRRDDGRVFSMRPDSVTQAFERAAKQAGIKDVRFHDSRHEATSRLADKLQAHELAKVTGHRDMRMVLRYYHPRAEDLAKKLD